MDNWLCNKCGKPVPLWNDALALEVLTYQEDEPTLFQRLMYGARHLFRTADCEGSPSRARYFCGELGRDTRGYPFHHEDRWMYRIAYARLVSAARERRASPEPGLADDEFYSWDEDPGYW